MLMKNFSTSVKYCHFYWSFAFTEEKLYAGGMQFLRFFTLSCFLVCTVNAHENHQHKQAQPANDRAKLTQVNETYLKSIKPIFSRACMDCHSDFTEYPWYYKIPGVKQMIDYDIKEAKEHLDMTDDFPFKGHHGDVYKDLQEIGEVIEENEMPLWRYRILHKEAWLSSQEKEKILSWVKQSLEFLK